MLRVLTYHRIADPRRTPALHPRLVSATPEVFAQHLDLLQSGYRVVSLEEVVAAALSGVQLPPRAVLLTFDDAYRDFLDSPWPLLRERGLPAVLFVPTAYPGDPGRSFWWDRLHRAFATTRHPALALQGFPALPLATAAARSRSLVAVQGHVKSLPHDAAMALVDEVVERLGGDTPAAPAVLSWDELRSLARAGLALAAHTRSHLLLTRVAPERAAEEVRASQADLEREVGPVLPVFAYPSGAHDDASVEVVRSAGFKLAFTQVDGHNDLQRADLLRLCRTNITRRTTAPLLRLRLQRWMTWVDRWRHRQPPAVRSRPAVEA